MIEHFSVAIIGSGAAAYSTADWLYKAGVQNVLIIAEDRLAGTSRNAGSDKQTYYKMSFTDLDSAGKMADALSSGGGMHKDTAFIEAVNSIKCFLRLVDYGVPFPQDEYGRFIGYQTDHDYAKRGTSIGPLTSKCMTECLENKVLSYENITFYDKTTVLKVVVENNVTVGLVCLKECSGDCEIIGISADNIVLATGGSACIYDSNVYPVSQSGALSLAIEAKARLNNLNEWQYGIASVAVKWNLSGSYQQVIPRYYSVDDTGKEREFLIDAFGSPETANNAVFLKGYQWPFDSRKANESSLVDLAIADEIMKGRQVFIDYRNNPIGYEYNKLSNEAREYLASSDSVKNTPIERLRALNPKAIEFYLDNGIDLEKSSLGIAVCAQHMNGGVDVDTDWQTSVRNLFAVGEVAGTFGIYRPGGSALNSTQVGGLRIAEYIARKKVKSKEENHLANIRLIADSIKNEQDYIDKCMSEKAVKMIDFTKEMTGHCAHTRNYEKIEDIHSRLLKQIENKYYSIFSKKYKEIRQLYKYRDTILSQEALTRTLLYCIPKIGSRGGAISFMSGEIVAENVKMQDYAVVTTCENVEFVKLREKPDTNFNFEKTWHRFNEKHDI